MEKPLDSQLGNSLQPPTQAYPSTSTSPTQNYLTTKYGLSCIHPGETSVTVAFCGAGRQLKFPDPGSALWKRGAPVRLNG
ncbi:uncharacterized protein EAE98_004566 [Botrytis deweyae]|uniref:Uncharacterized protein n=1 Tax=Botrytis deweyae TaxID=2478750 RepID=A0ABQ7IR92_9HELO|nr:uncharacterized protein EAE98_004566 [Botrytis deweyae]KAF7921408.1 hypothetical protein EAE99_007716 [Botrytis elliptica]KAF7931830.1 hypothetical protein EAE98_004566 [Botrytis deweyae]